MAEDETETPTGETPADGRIPLPPEQPPPEAELSGDRDIDPDAPQVELDKDVAAGSPEGAPSIPSPALGDAPPPPSAPGADDAGAGEEWWRQPAPSVREQIGEDWREQGAEAGVAAHELGYQIEQAAGRIGDAVAATAYPAAAKRELDIRWMRMSINGPAIFLALLVTWSGRTATDRMVHTVVTDGPFAPLGWLLLVVMVLGVVMFLPIGTPLAHAIGGLVQGIARGLVAAVRRGWQAPGIRYVMRLAVAVFIWSFVFAVIRVAGRGIITWLTGA